MKKRLPSSLHPEYCCKPYLMYNSTEKAGREYHVPKYLPRYLFIYKHSTLILMLESQVLRLL